MCIALIVCLLPALVVAGSEEGVRECTSGTCADNGALLQANVKHVPEEAEALAEDLEEQEEQADDLAKEEEEAEENDENEGEENEEEEEQEEADPLDLDGTLSEVSSSFSEDACDVSGTWTEHGGKSQIQFATNKDSLRLAFKGKPALTYQYADDKLVSLTVGEKQFAAEDLESDEGRAALAWLGKETYYHRMKSFSDSLGKNGLDGGKGRCMIQLHMTLIALHKGHGEEENDEGMVEEDATKSNRTEEDETTEGDANENRWGRRRRRRRRTWGPYGFGPGSGANACAATMTPDWECRVDSGWLELRRRRRGYPTGYDRGGSSRLRIGQALSRSGQKSVNCRGGGGGGGRNPNHCSGMCGRDCDCWSSVCGNSYACGYNPYCCAHDKTCMRRRIGTFVLCNIVVNDVRRACGR